MDAPPRPVKRPSDHGGVIRLILAGFLSCGCLAACSGNGVQDVDADGARRALRSALEAWQKGGPIGSLADQKPSIVAQDLDWESGATLVKFDVIDDGKGGVSSLRIPVELTLRDKAGKEARKTVRYMVGTSPVITVFREIF